MSSSQPVLIIGGGPVGLFLALLLAKADVSVTVLEASTDVGTETKAMAHQPSIFGEFKRAGIADDLFAKGMMANGFCFRKPAGEPIARMPAVPGKPSQLLLPQYQFWTILAKHLRTYEHAKLLMGRKVVSIQNDDSGPATVTAQTSDGKEEIFTAQHVCASDGSHSTMRRLCGIAFDGETLPEQLVATDVVYPFDKYGYPDTNFLVDKEHYGLIGHIQGDMWRLSYGCPDAMEYDEIAKGLPAKYEAMLPGPRPLDYKVNRIALYKAQQRVASTFRKGRVMLVGDAAHLTNPYAGLGLNTGFFDASSLATALSSVVNNGASDKLLDSWAEARRNVFIKIVDPVSRYALARVKDPVMAEQDKMIIAMKAGAVPTMPPSLATNVEELEGFVKA